MPQALYQLYSVLYRYANTGLNWTVSWQAQTSEPTYSLDTIKYKMPNYFMHGVRMRKSHEACALHEYELFWSTSTDGRNRRVTDLISKSKSCFDNRFQSQSFIFKLTCNHRIKIVMSQLECSVRPVRKFHARNCHTSRHTS
jgi:hypothetical protein